MIERLLINRAYARLWVGGQISQLGDMVFDTTVLLWIATVVARGKSWAPAAGSGVLIAAVVPVLLVSPFAGVYVDRWNPKRTMLVSDAVRGVLVGTLVLLALLPSGTLSTTGELVWIYAVVFLCSIVSRFFQPARLSIVADLVRAEDQPKGSSLSGVSSSIAGLIGPALAAPLLFTAGVQWAMVLNTASFAGSFVFVAAVSYRRPSSSPAEAGPGSSEGAARVGLRAELTAGFEVIWRTQVLKVLVICALIVNLAAGLLTTLNVFFVQINLHTNAKYYGLVATCTAVGDLIGALAASAVAARLGVNRGFAYGFGVCGAIMLVYARQTDFPVAGALFILMALPISIINVAISPILVAATPRELLGRVAGVIQPLTQATNLVGMAVAGYLASTLLHGFHHQVLGVWMGTYDLIFTCAGLLVMVGALVAWRGLRSPAAAAAPSESAASTPETTAVD
jgi:MFS family permease